MAQVGFRTLQTQRTRAFAACVSTLLLVAVLAGACGGDDPEPRTGGLPTPDVIATGLQVPWGIAFLPGGDALISERTTGRILRLHEGEVPQEVVQLDGVNSVGEGGLLGLAVSPTYDEDQFVYAYYTSASDNRIVRFTLGGAAGDEVGEEEVVLDGIEMAQRHDGGRLAFGPDGMLYATTGDAAESSLSQELDSLNGKILRIRPDGSVPPDNPFPDSLVYSLGHRNVEGITWDPAGRLWASEFGEDSWDEVNLIAPGANYGWPDVEGDGETDGGTFTNPVVTWPTSDASPSGIAYWEGSLYVAALRGQRLWRIAVAEDGSLGEPEGLFEGEYGRLRTVIVAPDGSLWAATSNTDGRGDPQDDDDRILRFPAR